MQDFCNHTHPLTCFYLKMSQPLPFATCISYFLNSKVALNTNPFSPRFLDLFLSSFQKNFTARTSLYSSGLSSITQRSSNKFLASAI